MAEKHDLSKKQKFRLSHVVAVAGLNFIHAYSQPLKSKKAEISAP
jgi:hypothetical protein